MKGLSWWSWVSFGHPTQEILEIWSEIIKSCFLFLTVVLVIPWHVLPVSLFLAYACQLITSQVFPAVTNDFFFHFLSITAGETCGHNVNISFLASRSFVGWATLITVGIKSMVTCLSLPAFSSLRYKLGSGETAWNIHNGSWQWMDR